MTRTTTRTDQHRPSQLDPADYEDVGYLDTGGYDDPGEQWIEPEHADLPFAPHSQAQWDQGYSRCGHCGQHARYFEIFWHSPSNTLLPVGMVCAGKLGLSSRYELEMRQAAERRKLAHVRGHSLAGDPAAQRATYWLMDVRFAQEERWEIERAVEAQHGISRDEDGGMRGGDSEAEWKAWKRDERAAYQQWQAQYGLDYKAENVASDMARKFDRYGSLSDKQVRYLLVLRQRASERAARVAAQLADRANAAPCPEGRVQVEGEVVKTDWKDDDWGGKAVMTVRDDRGWLVWGTQPSSLGYDSAKGDRVRFTAAVTPSDDPGFGFYKRPTKAEVIAQASDDDQASAPAPAGERPVERTAYWVQVGGKLSSSVATEEAAEHHVGHLIAGLDDLQARLVIEATELVEVEVRN